MTKHTVKNQKMIGLGALVVGIIMLFYSLHYMGVLSVDRERVNGASIPFLSHTPIGGQIEGSVKGSLLDRISQYDQEVQMLFYGGAIVTIVGAALLIRSKKRR